MDDIPIVATYSSERRSPYHEERMRQIRFQMWDDEKVGCVGVRVEETLIDHPPSFVNVMMCSRYRDHIGPVPQDFQLGGEAIGCRQVVGILPRDVFASACIEPEVQSTDNSTVRLAEISDPVVRAGEILDDLATLIGRSVIDNQQNKVPVGLNKNALDRRANRRLCIVYWQNHGHCWGRHIEPSSI